MDGFLENTDVHVWNSVFKHYNEALHAKGNKMKPAKKKDLLKLDEWYQTELPALIGERKKKHITQEELCKLMKWKLTRGKFRPRLTEMVQSNSEESVVEASTKAFQALPDLFAAIQALTVLRAIGPATASAVLAAGIPKRAAFMADESMLALPGLYPIKYDLPFYRQYMKQVSSIVKELNKQDADKAWTAHKVELTLWTYKVAQTLAPDILQSPQKSVKRTKQQIDSSELPKKKTKT